jgi:hypothetical protein
VNTFGPFRLFVLAKEMTDVIDQGDRKHAATGEPGLHQERPGGRAGRSRALAKGTIADRAEGRLLHPSASGKVSSGTTGEPDGHGRQAGIRMRAGRNRDRTRLAEAAAGGSAGGSGKRASAQWFGIDERR